jgi:hypothetical protein
MVLVFVVALLLQSCSNDTTQMAHVKFILVDAPGDYEAVTIDLKDVLINRTDTDNNWESLGAVAGKYNLLELTGGVEALIAENEIPAGLIKQVRLLLGPDNTITLKGGTVVKLDTPSAQQSGLKLKFNTELKAGVTYTFILDFDADKSVVRAGDSGKYNLKPVIRVTTTALSGAIIGKITPFNFVANVKALNATDTIATQTDNLGKFMLKGVLPGTYKVVVTPDPLSGFAPKEILNTNVTLGNVTDVGTITF